MNQGTIRAEPFVKSLVAQVVEGPRCQSVIGTIVTGKERRPAEPPSCNTRDRKRKKQVAAA